MSRENQLDLNAALDQAGPRENVSKKKGALPKAKSVEEYEREYWQKVYPETANPEHLENIQKHKEEILKTVDNPQAYATLDKPENRKIRIKKDKWEGWTDVKSLQFKDND